MYINICKWENDYALALSFTLFTKRKVYSQKELRFRSYQDPRNGATDILDCILGPLDVNFVLLFICLFHFYFCTA